MGQRHRRGNPPWLVKGLSVRRVDGPPGTLWLECGWVYGPTGESLQARLQFDLVPTVCPWCLGSGAQRCPGQPAPGEDPATWAEPLLELCEGCAGSGRTLRPPQVPRRTFCSRVLEAFARSNGDKPIESQVSFPMEGA